MLSIHSLISPKCIYINPEVKSKEELLRLMVEGLSAEYKIADSELLFEDVMRRENMAVTALGCGCAVPHTLTAAVEKTILAAAVMAEGIEYSAPDEEPVTIVLMMVGPESEVRLHLKLLSKIARFFHNENFRNQLRLAKTPDDFLKIFRKQED